MNKRSESDEPARALPVAERFGLRYGDRGTMTSRTIMLDELKTVFSSLPAKSSRQEIVGFIVAGNGLNKKTGATRKLTAQRLSELYGLNPAIPIYRVLRSFWEVDPLGHPLLAFLCAFARDPLLRMTRDPILRAVEGEEVAKIQLEDSVRLHAPGRFNDSILNKIARNAGSSWTQSGHLQGRVRKIRAQAQATPATAAFALLLASLEGLGGSRALESVWRQLLDRPQSELLGLAHAAARMGIMDFRKSAEVIQFSFASLLTEEERRWLHEPH